MHRIGSCAGRAVEARILSLNWLCGLAIAYQWLARVLCDTLRMNEVTISQ